MKVRLRLPWLVYAGLFCFTTLVYAQTGIVPRVTLPDLGEFPFVSLFIDLEDTNGKFLHGLQGVDFQVIEDSIPIPVSNAVEMRVGLQIVIAINPGRPFMVRNNKGDSRYDLAVEHLISWGRSRQGSTLDDYSLIVSDGTEHTHISGLEVLLTRLSEIQKDSLATASGLDSLARAVEIAADQTPRSGMKRAVLFITSPMERSQTEQVENIYSRAAQQNIRLFIWVVGPVDDLDSKAANQDLLTLAEKTGGRFFHYIDKEAFPPIQDLLTPLRSVYQLKYLSRIKTGGQHTVRVITRYKEMQLESPEQVFDLVLLSPKPVFITPVIQINRHIPEDGSNEENPKPDHVNLLPSQLIYKILVDFPDGQVRNLARSRLYVDGELVVENLTHPFDQFTWDLSGYVQSGEHVLQAEVLDSYGLSGRSIETLVEIIVDQPARPATFQWNNLSIALVSLGGLLILMLVLIVMIFSGKFRFAQHGGKNRQKSIKRVGRHNP
jgi:hypothetical protein